MTHAATNPAVDELFQRWKQFLDGGTLTTAAYIAGDRPDLVDPLQHYINDFLADGASVVEETLTVAGPHGADAPPDLPDLTVLGRLGSGGMGVVYRVRDPLDREFALKLARREHLSETGRERFLDEAKAMRRLDHPHVARVERYSFTPAGQPYFLMAIYPANLADRLAEYQADPRKAVRLMAAVAEGVGHLHANGFIHRDLKPHNVLLTADGEPAVSDFGLVKNLTDSGSGGPAAVAGNGSAETQPPGDRPSKTVAGVAMGTRRYMAPEQAAGLVHLASPKWDVWALGVVLHELLTGQFPRSSWRPERMLDPNEPDNPPPSTIKPGLDPKLERIVQKCLARDEKKRYADGGEVANALHKCLAANRRLGRMVVCTAAALILMGAALLSAWRIGATPPGDDAVPDPPFEVDRRVLQSGEAVHFDPAERLAANAYVLIGGGEQAKLLVDKESNALRISVTEPLLIVLSDNPGIRAYRVEAEVNQTIANPTSQVGIFQGLRSVRVSDRERLTFAALTVNKFSRPGDAGRWSFGLVSASPPPREANQKGMNYSTVAIRPGALGRDNYKAGGWIKLAVDVREDSSRWHLSDGITHSLSRPLPDLLQHEFTKIIPSHPGDTVDLPPAGGVGFFISNTNCRIRNARLVPIPERSQDK